MGHLFQWRLPLLEKRLNNRKGFSQNRKSVSTIRNEKFVLKYVSARQKIAFIRRSIWKKKKKNLARKSVSTSRNKVSLKKMLLHLNFKNFSKTLNDRILIPLDRKSVSTSWKEENLFSQPRISDKWTKLFFTRQRNDF